MLQVMVNRFSPFEGIIQKRRKALSNLNHYKKHEVPNVDWYEH
jgi:hypothetical protein